jgi:hypothetical protein
MAFALFIISGFIAAYWCMPDKQQRSGKARNPFTGEEW